MISSRMIVWYAWFACGTTYSLKAMENREIKNAITYTGVARRKKFCPPARITMISLVPLNRPKVIKDPSKTDIGNVKITIFGNANKKARVTDQMLAPYSVIY